MIPPAQDKPKKSFGPESDFFQKLKGQMVQIIFAGPDEVSVKAKLLWVDRFSIGVRFDNGREMLVYKSGIATLELVA